MIRKSIFYRFILTVAFFLGTSREWTDRYPSSRVVGELLRRTFAARFYHRGYQASDYSAPKNNNVLGQYRGALFRHRVDAVSVEYRGYLLHRFHNYRRKSYRLINRP